MTRSDELRRQIAQLDELLRGGVLTSEAARQARARLEDELLAAVLRPATAAAAAADTVVAASAAAPLNSLGASAAGSPAEAPSATAAPAATAALLAVQRPSRGLWLGVIGFVLAVGVAGYTWLGNFDGWSAASTAAAVPATAPDGSPEMGVTQIEKLIDHLAQRLKSAPDDAEGWVMLGRSYSVLGRHAESLPAYRRAVELRPRDAQAHADLADALGSVSGKTLDGEPEQLVAKALAIDPDNVKALSLSGTLLFNRGDSAAAARQWAHALRGLDPNSDMARQVQGALDEARRRAGLPAMPSASPAVPDSSVTAGATPSGATITGRVTLSASLKARAAPDDTVFVFARPVAGGKAPLAILRRQVKDLPLEFTLDDSLAMSPALRLSSVREVHVGARISKSGNAMPQPGDLQGLSAAVPVGARGVNVEIGEAVR